jgi:hypothetical protein
VVERVLRGTWLLICQFIEALNVIVQDCKSSRKAPTMKGIISSVAMVLLGTMVYVALGIALVSAG